MLSIGPRLRYASRNYPVAYSLVLCLIVLGGFFASMAVVATTVGHPGLSYDKKMIIIIVQMNLFVINSWLLWESGVALGEALEEKGRRKKEEDGSKKGN